VFHPSSDQGDIPLMNVGVGSGNGTVQAALSSNHSSHAKGKTIWTLLSDKYSVTATCQGLSEDQNARRSEICCDEWILTSIRIRTLSLSGRVQCTIDRDQEHPLRPTIRGRPLTGTGRTATSQRQTSPCPPIKTYLFRRRYP